MHIREDTIHFLLLKIAMTTTTPPTQKKKYKDFGNVLLDIFVGDDGMVKNYLTVDCFFSNGIFFWQPNHLDSKAFMQNILNY